MTGHRCLDCATVDEWNAASAEAMRRTYVLAGSQREFEEWRGDAAPDSRVRFVSSARSLEGVVMGARTARIVVLPGAQLHPEAEEIARVIYRNRARSVVPAPIDVGHVRALPAATS